MPFLDSICLLVARDHGWSVITHDRATRKACDGNEIAVVDAFDLILKLQEGAHLALERTIRTAQMLREANPYCISERQLKDLEQRMNRFGRAGAIT
jgi:hypothetical protein